MQWYRQKNIQHRYFMVLAGTLLPFSGVLIVLFTSCSMTEEERYDKLTFFFDGVPDPMQEEQLNVDSDGEQSITGEQETQQKRAKGSVHEPYKNDNCANCHMKSFSNELVTEKSMLCQRCHPAETFTGAYVHGPVASGQCYICHDPHKSPYPHLVLALGSDICLKCHTTETFTQLETHQTEMGEACLDCHQPHVADNKYFLDL